MQRFSLVIFASSSARLDASEVLPMPPLFEKIEIILHLFLLFFSLFSEIILFNTEQNSFLL